jgi:outer membrane immunogenic protein
MKKTATIGLSACLILAAGAALAADMPVKARPLAAAPIVGWSGFYIGGNVGYGWSTSDGGTACIDDAGVPNGPFCQVVPGGQVKARGALGGAQVGYNWQSGQWVAGLESDAQLSGISGSTTVNGPFFFVNGGGPALPPGVFLASHRLEWFGTTRVRFGYAGIERTLLYVTGGVAYGAVELSSNLIAPNAGTIYPGSKSATRVGWVIGGGLEYAMTANWSAKLEGLYIDLGEETTVGREVPLTFPPNGFVRTKDFDLNYAIVRAGLNYKIGR